MDKFDLQSINGRRPYIRTLMFVLQKAVNELYPDKKLVLDYSLPSGLYGEVKGLEMTPERVQQLKERMRIIVDANFPIEEDVMDLQEAIRIFESNNQIEKATIARTSGVPFVRVCKMGNTIDNFYGQMLSSTGDVKVFDLIPYLQGMCLVVPSTENPKEVTKTIPQEKIASIFQEHSNWCTILKAKGIGSLNTALTQGRAKELIQLSEALHEHRYSEIANQITERIDKVRLVLIAGPSSSGKTSTSKRIALHLKVNMINPIVIELDNYFVSRDKTPRDENGDYDFESLYALDLPYLNKQLNQLFSGEEIEIPRYDFVTGQRTFAGQRLKLGKGDILVMEGIHALNPKLTDQISDEMKFKVYASALTSLSVDENNNISTSDNRLLRRIVRDNQYRGINPEQTILRWPSVRAGEIKNIFPYQENADAMFNSALIYEIPMLKCYAEPLLRSVDPHSPAYPEATRLLDFLRDIIALTPLEIATIPPTSILREFIGGSSFSY
ncbi:MAG: nucleoside kinase [Bacteroidales bacterium]|nr:nucleoside kinase [Bacteroidales bacterium]MDD3201309.1 nucleoside kinase [Bacteroidales bacterium]